MKKKNFLFLVIFIFLTLLPKQLLSEEVPKSPPPMPKLTVNDCVILALMNNLDVRGAYLDRILNRFDLQRAEQQYWLPTDPTLTLSGATNSIYSGDDTRTQDLRPGGKFVSSLGLPTGGKIDLSWDNSAYRSDIGVAYAYTSGWSATFTQPLLKGGGIDNAQFAVKSARIQEEQNILALRETIVSQIGTALSNYRSYAAAVRTYENSRKALENAKKTHEVNKAMVEAGRTARTELIQSEANIANSELTVVSSRNSMDSARLTLLSFLNIDRNFQFEIVDENEAKVMPPSFEEAVEVALRNKPDYLKDVYTLEVNKWALKNATRNKMWALNLTASSAAGKTGDGETFADAFGNQSISKRNWSVGLDLVIPLTALTADKRAYLQARNTLEKGQWNLRKKRADIEIAIQNAIRNVDMMYRRLELAKQARRLSEQKLEIEQEKLRAGRTTNFQLVNFQDDLKTRQDAERDAIKDYLDSLNTLDKEMGVTLHRWGIMITKEDDAIRIPENDRNRAEQKMTELKAAPGTPERKEP